MICPECNGKGEVKYYRETDRDKTSVTVKGFIDICHTCHGSGRKIMTNGDRIRAMTDEELAMFLDGFDSCPSHYCREACLDWLKQPAEEA